MPSHGAGLFLAGGGLTRAAPAARRVDEATFTLVYEKTVGPLRSYLRRLCTDPAAADDLLQETYLRFVRAAPETRDERETSAYLYRVATNLATDRWRRESRTRTVPAPRAEELLSSPPDGAAVPRRDLQRVFERLLPREPAMLSLAYVEGFDHAEIAARMGLAPRSIRVLLFRARRKFAGMLAAEGLVPEKMA